MKTFKNSAAMTAELKDIIEKTRTRAIQDISNQLVDDCSTQSLAPILTGALRATITYGIEEDTAKATGEITWLVPYARRRWYEGSKSGVPMWATVGMKRNEASYRKIVNEIFNEEKKN